MRHLNDEALARLVDEPPEAAEALHLRECLVCRRELAEMRAQTQALGALTMEADEPAPAAAWAGLEARLLAEGLIRAPAPRGRLIILRPGTLRAAAALALFLLGGAAGASLWRPRAPEPRLAADTAATPRAASRPSALMGEPAVVYQVADAGAPNRAGVQQTSTARLAAIRTEPADTPRAAAPRERSPAPRRATPREADEAARALMKAQAAYVVALQRYADIADPRSGNDAATRMAALNRLVELTAEALERAPGDPVINGYHLAATAERDRLRREMQRDAETDWF